MLPDWEVWLDNNISPIIAKWLKEYFMIEVKSAFSLQIAQIADLAFYNKAKNYGKVIILTKDSDIPKLVAEFDSPPKVIFLKVGNCDNKVLFELLVKHLSKAIRILIDFETDIYQIET